MDTFAENYQQWLDDQQHGVFVERPLTIKVECGPTTLPSPVRAEASVVMFSKSAFLPVDRSRNSFCPVVLAF